MIKWLTLYPGHLRLKLINWWQFNSNLMGKLNTIFSSGVCTKTGHFSTVSSNLFVLIMIHLTCTHQVSAMNQTLGKDRTIVKSSSPGASILLGGGAGCRHSKQPMSEWIHEENSEWQGLGEDKQHNIWFATLPLQRASPNGFLSFHIVGVDTWEVCVPICTLSLGPFELS